MNSLRRWLYRPKRSDPSLLAQFYFADEELNLIAAELDGFEGRKDPERCAALVNQLRACQARVLNIVSQMMDESIKDQRALRDFRVKFPDDVIQENLAGQLWFGAECLAAGSSIMNREVESACMRPLARALTKNLDSLRTILREQCLHNVDEYSDVIKENLIIFDKLFAEFELSYVSAMVSVKTAHEYDMIQEITVLFSETVQRALKIGLLTQEMIDEYDPALMFTIPRLAIISGVLIFKDGPLNPDNDPWNISEMFRPFQTLLLKIRELLGILTSEELTTLERALCSQDEPSFLLSLEEKRKQAREERRKQKKERKGSTGKVKNSRKTSDGDNGSIESELTANEIAERLEALALNFEATHNSSGNNDTNGESVEKPTSDSTDPVVNGNNSVNGDLPTSSVQNGSSNLPKHQANDSSPDRQGLVVDLGCVEDLYREANLDSSDMITVSSSSAYRGSNLLVQGIRMPAGFRNNEGESQMPPADDSHSLSSLSNVNIENHNHHPDHFDSSNEPCRTNDEVLNDQDRFSLNKCDSRDSGLQSEVVSNSGSMFTISSSDSNQQILSSDSIPTPSDQNGTDSSEEVDSHDLSTERPDDSTKQLENSSDSSATIVKAVSEDEVRESDSGEHGATNKHATVNFDTSQDIEDTNLSLPSDSCEKDKDIQISELSKEAERASMPIEPEIVFDSPMAGQNDDSDSDSVQMENGIHGNNDPVLSKDLLDDSNQSLTSSVDSNHSSDISCDKSKSDVQTDALPDEVRHHVDKDILVNSTNDAQDNRTDCGCSMMTNGIDEPSNGELSVSGLSENGGGNEEMGKQMVDSGLGQSDGICSEVPSLSQQDSTSSTSTPDASMSQELTTVDVSSNTTTSTDSAKVEITDTDCSTKQSNEMPHSSETTPQSEEVVNGHDAAPVNSVKDGHRKGLVANGKAKSNSKKRSKNGEKRSRRRDGTYRPTLCPHHAKMLREAHQTLDAEHYNSSDTSSYTSECGDQEEIALAIEAAESATRNHVRARFRSSSDMIHRLFVCISGVADQLQTNFAGDLRNILRCVFDMNCPDPLDTCDTDKPKDATPLGAAYRAMSHASRTPRHRHSSLRRDPPTWVPDDQSNDCMACQVPFNFLRRRHHCRNCGKIFCSRCSSNFVPLPHFGQDKAVRICNRCFMFQPRFVLSV